LILRFQFA